jgi:uncharacterized protein YdbL (DUF1318 family)
MNKNIFKIVISLLLACIFIVGTAAWGANIKTRMKNRLPAIMALKDKGIVGETNNGYLQFRGAAKEKEDVVKAENEDRKKVYAAIAKQQGVTIDVVEKRRALQIAQIAKPGHWLQDEAGKWYQKK